MEFLGEVFTWFTTSSNWTGETGVLVRVWEHVVLSTVSMAIALVIAVPPALYLGHTGRGGFFAVTFANVGRAVPSFGIVALALPVSIELGLGLEPWPALLALIVLAIPPIFTNTYTGIREVDTAMVEAARGMGMSGTTMLRRVELPLASPVILAGVRISAVQVVATATLAALVAGGGLGRFIVDGFAIQDSVQVFAGGLLVAVLAIITELVFSGLERWLVPQPIRTSPARADQEVVWSAT